MAHICPPLLFRSGGILRTDEARQARQPWRPSARTEQTVRLSTYMSHRRSFREIAHLTISHSLTMSDFGRETKTQAVVEAATADPSSHFFVEGRKDFYVGQIAENGGGQSYQHADGAPVETRSPLGYNVGFWTATFLNVSMLIGTGIFSTRESCRSSRSWLD